MLLKNLTGNTQSKGKYSIEPQCWGVIPDRIAGSWAESSNFERLPESKAIVIYAGCPLGTTGGGQQPTQIARALARMGHQVVYIQNIPQPDPELIVLGDSKLLYSEPAEPGELERHHEIFRSLDVGAVLFTFPSNYCSSIASSGIIDRDKTAYWCLDDWTAIHESMGHRRYQSIHEVRMVKNVGILIATSNRLTEHITKIIGYGNECHYIPNGFSRDNFPEVEHVEIPDDMAIGEKTIVYWGELGGDWIDWDAIDLIAESYPTWQINLIGPEKHSTKPVQRDNVHYLGEKPVSELIAYGLNADMGIIPFKDCDLVKVVNPIKAYEYLACGLTILAPHAMEEIRSFPNRLIYGSEYSITDHLNEWKMGYHLKDSKSKCQVFLDSSTWESRARRFLEVTCPSLLQMPLLNSTIG